MKLKKGSAAAKAYMAKIRSKRKTVKSEKGNWSLADRKQLAKELGEDFYSAEDWKKLTGKTKTKRSVAKKISGTKRKTKRSVGSSLKLTSKEKRLGYTDHKDNKSHNVNIRVVSGVNKIGAIDLNVVGNELLKLENEIRELSSFIRSEKNASERKRLKEIKDIKQNQFKTLKSYLNSIARFTFKR